MTKKQDKIDRRDFLKTTGAAGLASVFAGTAFAQSDKTGSTKPESPSKTFPQVPRRKLGRTGVEVASLSLGANRLQDQIILKMALRWGINYWDTSHSYVGGNSERTIGQFLKKNPQKRKDLFIVTKASQANTVSEKEARLQTSLERMNTNYIDLYYGVHGLSDPSQLTDELRKWVADAKKRKVIRYFGFSTHKNMAGNLKAAAKLGWIDALMTSCNFRLMQDPEMQDAIEACHKAGIGIIAVKTTGVRSGIEKETEADKKIDGHFLSRGFTEVQAKIKAVLDDKRISSACVGMRNAANFTENAAAALDKTKLSYKDRKILTEYAKATCSGYCTGCADICQAALPQAPYISDIMRYLMYYNSYGDQDRAKELFARIPCEVRNKLAAIDYRKAEKFCPQNLHIAKFINEALKKLA